MAPKSLTRNQREGEEGGALRSVAGSGTEVHKGTAGRPLCGPRLTRAESEDRAMVCVLVGLIFAVGIFIGGMLGLSPAGQMLAGLSLLAFGVLALLLFVLHEGDRQDAGHVSQEANVRLNITCDAETFDREFRRAIASVQAPPEDTRG